MNHPFLLAPQRILMTTDPVGGLWTYTLELCRALAEHDVQVLLAGMGGRPSPEQRGQAQQLPNVELAESHYKLEWMAAPWRDVDAAGEWLLDLERRFQPDVIHLNGCAHGSLKFRAPKIVVAHSCVLSWWQAVNNCPAPNEWNEYARRVHEGLLAADLVITPTMAMRDLLEQQYGPLPGAEVIRHGRCADNFQIGTKELLVFSSGRVWDAARNLNTLAEIAPQLPWPVLVAGDRSSPEGWPVKLPNVQLLGRLYEAETAAMYARAAIYVLPARYEPFGLSVLDAALSGCALVLGDIPSLRELWDGAAVFAAPSDASALRAQLLDLIARPALRQQLAVLARRRALELGSDRMSAAYRSAYAEVMMARAPIARELESLLAPAAPPVAPFRWQPQFR